MIKTDERKLEIKYISAQVPWMNIKKYIGQ